ncbi:hypothetical protein [Clostridium sp. E02]|uniref:hypothetical protein n=1 Tax=Clostridium sp. E02 TaxID=2487134 RepID=UPI000F51DBBD|nr:hypothetical protein [Clostridium sp. E02]
MENLEIEVPTDTAYKQGIGQDGVFLGNDVDKINLDLEEKEKQYDVMKRWRPSIDKPLSGDLNELSWIYKELTEFVLDGTKGEVREEDKAELKQALSESLMKVLNSRLGELKLLIKSFGSVRAMNALKASLYQSVVKMRDSVTEFDTEFDQELNELFPGIKYEGKDSGNQRGSGIRNLVNHGENQLEQGIIYERDRSGTIKNDPKFANTIFEETSIVVMDNRNSSNEKVVTPPILKPLIYSGEDLEFAERFARYVNRGGNLLRMSELTGESEELYGFLAALMAIKAQIFTQCTGMEKGLAFDLREASDRLSDYYIQQAAKKTAANSKKTDNKKSFEVNASYKIFYSIMNAYQKKQDLNDAANKGIRHAYQQFLKKSDYEDLGGVMSFFRKNKGDLVDDWNEGKRLLERDWNGFLSFQSKDNPDNRSIDILELSPWGMFLKPGSDLGDERESSLWLRVLGGILILLVVVILFLF